jgi:2-iminobutanoate/2-iminopropanoate deaminase
MAKQEIRSEQGAPPVGPYSQGIRAGDFLFVSGQVPIDPGSREIVGTTIEEQTERVLENIRAVLEAAGAGMADVVKTTVHLRDLELFARFNEVYGRAFPDPKPARTTVGSTLPGAIMVEIDVVALVP